MAQILDGKTLAQQIQADLSQQVASLTQQGGRPPGLAVVMVGDNPASAAYVRNKERACDRVGIASFGKHLPGDTDQETLSRLIDDLNQDDRVDGILIQLPLPDHLNSVTLLNQIAPDKDADGLHPTNLGRLLRGAVVVGRSILVGKPLAMMLLEENATVTIAHSRSQNLADITRSADILVAAVGRPQMITAEMVKPGATVIDVGINRVTDASGKSKLVGDVDFDSVEPVAGSITPVPGGVGPMTVTMLLHNTVWSYRQRLSS